MDIETVLLDFGGTLANGELDWQPYHESIRNYLVSLGYDISIKDLKKALRNAFENLEKKRTRGFEMTFEEVYSIFLGNLGIIYDDSVLEWLNENFRNFHNTNFYPCVEDVLQELSSQYKVVLISNTMSNQPKLLLKKSNLEQYFDLIVCSRDLGVRKPNPEIFKSVLERIHAEPRTSVHVGDSVEADMYGAKDSGITGIWIKTSDQPPWSGYAINSICDLPRFLEVLKKGEVE